MSAAEIHCHPARIMEASPSFGTGRETMPILGLLLAVLAAAGVWYYRIRVLRDVGSDLADLAGRARGAYRRSKFRQQSEGAALATIDNPALAAAVLFYALAMEDPKTLHKSEVTIREQLEPIVAAGDLDELLSYAEWVARAVVDPRDLVRRFKPLWQEKLTPNERQQLLGMAETVAAQSATATSSRLTLDSLRTALAP